MFNDFLKIKKESSITGKIFNALQAPQFDIKRFSESPHFKKNIFKSQFKKTVLKRGTN